MRKRKFPVKKISPTQLTEIKNSCRSKFQSSIRTLESLLANVEKGTVKEEDAKLQGTSMYTNALEEYGKLVLLNSVSISNDDVDLSSIEEDFFDHDAKMKSALSDLSPKAGVVRRAPFDANIFDPAIFDATDTTATFDLRLKLLHTDVDKSGDVKSTPVLDLQALKNAINEFKNGQFYK